MAFMQREIVECNFRRVETTHGTEVIPDFVESSADPEYLQDYCEGKIQEVGEVESGWVGRMSAPGYLDCTSWSHGKTREEVASQLVEYYGEEEGEA